MPTPLWVFLAVVVLVLATSIGYFTDWILSRWPRLFFKVRGIPPEWPPPRVVKAAWPQKPPPPNTVGRWHFACGDCRIVWTAEVDSRQPSSFHPPCPGCEEKLGAYLRSRR